jgi:hypothetical protein
MATVQGLLQVNGASGVSIGASQTGLAMSAGLSGRGPSWFVSSQLTATPPR